jgi:hypothetical protein
LFGILDAILNQLIAKRNSSLEFREGGEEGHQPFWAWKLSTLAPHKFLRHHGLNNSFKESIGLTELICRIPVAFGLSLRAYLLRRKVLNDVHCSIILGIKNQPDFQNLAGSRPQKKFGLFRSRLDN